MLPLEVAVSNASSLERPDASVVPSMEQQHPLSAPDTSQVSEKPDNAIVTTLDQSSESQYVTGIKLVLVVASVALGCFLMIVDTMVISTVSTALNSPRLMLSSYHHLGYSSYHR